MKLSFPGFVKNQDPPDCQVWIEGAIPTLKGMVGPLMQQLLPDTGHNKYTGHKHCQVHLSLKEKARYLFN